LSWKKNKKEKELQLSFAEEHENEGGQRKESLYTRKKILRLVKEI